MSLAVLALPARGQVNPSLEETRVPEAELAAAKPGTLFRIWPLEGGGVSRYKAYRILYRSTDFDGRPVAVTGALLFPPNPPESGKRRDIVAWAHPTSGVVSRCAPTLLPDLTGTIQGIDEMADQGYVVVATDYVGLGTPDAHPYLVGESAAHAVLDSVRAARDLADAHAGNRFAVWGHSQGGHAALATGQLAASYAPELHLVGVAAAAPATDLPALYDADMNSASGRSITAMSVLSWSRVFKLPLDSLVKPDAKPRFEALAKDCIETINQFIKEDHDVKTLGHDFLTVDPVTYPPLRALMERYSAGPLPPSVPVFIAQGNADKLVRPSITRAYVTRLCKEGVRVKLDVLDGVGHLTAGRDSAYAAVRWMTDRFQGRPPPSDC
jgi:acetyl esterase/lipase